MTILRNQIRFIKHYFKVLGLRLKTVLNEYRKSGKTQENWRAREVKTPERRPVFLETDFKPVESSAGLQNAFHSFRRHFFNQFNVKRPVIVPKEIKLSAFREHGLTESGMPYMFVQKPSTTGFLLECAEGGWVVSQATKDYGNNKFIRSSQLWDQIQIYAAVGDDGPRYRVDSERFGLKRASVLLYESKLAEACMDSM